MKKIIFFFFLLLSVVGNAQINKGAYLIGGSLGTALSQREIGASDYNSSFINISPSVGKFVKENTAVGVNLTFGYGKNLSYYGNVDSVASKVNVYGAGVVCRKYKKLAKDFYLFGEANLGYNYTRYSDKATPSSSYTNRDKIHNVNVGIVPGVSYKICNKLFVELTVPEVANIGYSHSKANIGNKSNSFYFNTSLDNNFLNSLGFGFRVIL